MLNKCFIFVISAVLIVAVYFPARHARHYEYVVDEDILKELVTSKNSQGNLKTCSYQNIILNNSDIEFDKFDWKAEFKKPLKGGEYFPENCLSSYRVAVVVPYRNRTRQLSIFLKYMHVFLQNQNISYRIIIADQNDTLPFNRGKMLNYGAKVAMDMGIECLILHDVDLLPVNTGNIYACSKRPRHMSSSIDVFRYNLPYLQLFGGAAALLSSQFKAVNGMSNYFDGWGAEDDDFYKRLEVHNLIPYRFSPRISKYIMLNHKKEKANKERFDKLVRSVERHRIDGLNSLSNHFSVVFEDLYTHVVI